MTATTAMSCYRFSLKLWSNVLLHELGVADQAVMFSTTVIFPLHSKRQLISSGMKFPQALRDLCLGSSTREPKDMTRDNSPIEDGSAHTVIKKRKRGCLNFVL